jgi:hypothetical protein
MRFFIFILLFGLSNAFAIDDSQIKSLSNSSTWLRLLHYKKNTFSSGYHSEIDGPGFFISPQGRSNPSAELLQDIKAFRTSEKDFGKFKMTAQCVFPARYLFLKSQLGQFTKDQICTDFSEWKKNLSPQEIYLIFSSAYPNNPASSFGHTFLRIKTHKEESDLLDYAINYSADTLGTHDAFKYVINGVFGGYWGHFYLEKYYLKVNDYNNTESRDLWEYELNFSKEDFDRFTNHLWELYSSATITYFFFDKNCSYHLLTLLEVAKPEWNLTDEYYHSVLPSYTLPSETIKTIAKYPNAIKNVSYRPAKRKILFQKRDSLSTEEKTDLMAVINDKKDTSEIKNPFLLDTLIEYYDYKKRQEAKHPKEKTLLQLRTLLVQRASLPKSPSRNLAEINSRGRPDHSQAPHSVWLASGHQPASSFLRFKYKWGMHDLLNTTEGYDLNQQIDFVNLSFDYRLTEKKFIFHEFKPIEILSLLPTDPLETKFSWKIASSFQQLISQTCVECYKGWIHGGWGLTKSVLKENFLIYALALAHAQYSQQLSQEFQVGPAVESGILWQRFSKFKTLIRFFQFINLNEPKKTQNLSKWDFEVRTPITQNLETRAQLSYQNQADDSKKSVTEGDFSLGFSF